MYWPGSLDLVAVEEAAGLRGSPVRPAQGANQEAVLRPLRQTEAKKIAAVIVFVCFLTF